MPTIMSHALVGAAITTLVPFEKRPRFVAAVAAGLAMLPDSDVLAYLFGISPPSLWAHRGISHSLLAALVSAVAVSRIAYGSAGERLMTCLFLAMASHGALDALTTGGLGVAFFAPFENSRYFFPWRPIVVSPLGLRFFGERGLRTLRSELRWIWLPTLAVVGGAALVRRLRSPARMRNASDSG